MKKEITYEKEPEDMTDEEIEKELKESYTNIRKIEVLEKLPFEEWTKDELLEAITSFSLYKCAGSLPTYINTMPEYVRVGRYRKNEKDFEEYKIIELTDEMKEELLSTQRKIIRCHALLDELPFSEWTRQELIKFVNKYNKHYDNWWD